MDWAAERFSDPHSTRATPQRGAASAASKKLKLPPLDATSDPSEADPFSDEGRKAVRKLAKGKGKALVVHSSGSEPEPEDEEMDELEDSDEGVQRVRALAKSLKGSRSAGEASSSAHGKAVGKSVASKFIKGKGKAGSKSFSVVVPTTSSSSKSKQKAIVISDSDNSDEDFAPEDVDNSVAADSDVSMEEMAEFLSDVDTEDDELDRLERMKRMQKKSKKPQDPNRAPARKGAEISDKLKAAMKKMSQVCGVLL